MNKDITTALISGAIATGVLYVVFKAFNTTPSKLATSIQNKIRSKLF